MVIQDRMTHRRNLSIIARASSNNKDQRGAIRSPLLLTAVRIGDTAVSFPQKQRPTSSVTFSMLVSETVYKLVMLVERILRWMTKFIFHPCILQYRCLFW
jgi:hypothetical protein